MFALAPSSRAALGGVAIIAFVAAFASAPIVARGAGDAAPAPSASPSPLRQVLAAVVMPRRDPFAGGLPPFRRARRSIADDPSAVAQRMAAAVSPPAFPQFPAAAMTIVPPPPGAAALASRQTQQTRVTAIVTGAHPSALVDEAGATRVVTVGDPLGDDRVVAIDLAGVLLARGTLLRIAPLPGGP